MYRDQLSHEARLIVQGQQAFVRDVAAVWARVKSWLGTKAANVLMVDKYRR